MIDSGNYHAQIHTHNLYTVFYAQAEMYQKAVCIHTEWTTSRIYLVKEMIAKGYHDNVQLDPRFSGNKVNGNKRTYFVDGGMVCNGNM